MKRVLYIFVTVAVALCVAYPVQSSPALELLEVHLIEGSADLDLSGLAYCQESLLTVSDKIEGQIFSMEFNHSGVSLGEYQHFNPPSHAHTVPWLRKVISYFRGLLGQSTTDWEGISCDRDRVYLISEIFGAVLILQNSAQPEWLPLVDEDTIASYELYENAFIGFESISFVDEQTLFVGHERNPAAGLSYNFAQHSAHITHSAPISSFLGYTKPDIAPNDITGSDTRGDVLFTLHRNARQICAQKIQPPFEHFLGCRSFAATETSTPNTYPSMDYGRAEGLAVTDDKLYVVLDNNGDELISNGSSEALLFVFENPW